MAPPMRLRARVKGTDMYVDATYPQAMANTPMGGSASAPYQTAGRGPRSRAWRAPGIGPNAALDYSAGTLRRQTRELMRQNPTARTIRDRLTSNVVGTGIVPEIADEAVKVAFNAWTDDCALDGTLDFYGIQDQAFAAVVEAGEVLVRFRLVDNAIPGTVPLRLQVLEAEYLTTERNEDLGGGAYIRQGVEFNGQGQRVAYWLWPTHPEDLSPGTYNFTPTRVPASEIIHLFRPDRPGQIRGITWLASILGLLKDIAEYNDAEVVRKKVAALFVGFVKRPFPKDGVDSDDLVKMFGAAAAVSDDNVGNVEMEPGSLQFLDPGEEIEFAEPADVGNQYAEFLKQQWQSIAAAMGILYEQLRGDYASGNDRLYRAAINEFKRRIRQLQHHLMVFQLCRPVWNRWVLVAKLVGVIPADYVGSAVPWLPEEWPYINPLQDVQATLAEIRGGINSRTRAAAARRSSAAEIDAENARDQTRAAGMGLVYDANARQVDNRGQMQPEAAPEVDDPEPEDKP
ncbi:phage portal protein [Nitrospirillum iridis]|uniref:Lambda family phage portal protein n=1 Tax=Nitrospirillum iridis TaxID=765888 RepID=A0A7X0AZA0_9PROT|nr:phage portal protein [Nitrospirillum iridis]MBB6251421.1 lambda family phage portal protein [Nitrospirillum iridis]